MDFYKNIALYKYAYYSIKFPILSALVLSDKYDKVTHQHVDDILTEVGIWSQINVSRHFCYTRILKNLANMMKRI